MRVHEITFQNFRNFRPSKKVSFVDPLLGEVRPITVLAGTNGAGKTTILDTIETAARVFQIQASPNSPRSSSNTLQNALSQTKGSLFILKCQIPIFDKRPDFIDKTDEHIWSHEFTVSYPLPEFMKTVNLSTVDPYVLISLDESLHQRDELLGGVIYFPAERQIFSNGGGAIEPPDTSQEWVYRFNYSKQWKNSLEQFLVWQNYLDLEEHQHNQANLKPYTSRIETILGQNRKVQISKGRVTVTTTWGNKVSIAQLPSGEKQLLLMFGELARQLRKGGLLMIDEPEISLHPSYQRMMIHQLRQLAREWDLQIILATHSLEILRLFHESEIIFLDQLEAEPVP